MTTKNPDVLYEVRNGAGEVLRSGRRTADGEILVNRGNGEFLFEERDGGFFEVGAYASKDYAVPTERPDIPLAAAPAIQDLVEMSDNPVHLSGAPLAGTSQCACGRILEGTVCGCSDHIQFGPALAALKEVLPVQSSFLAAAGDPQSAPGEKGQYSSLFPQPIDIIESWGLNFHEAQVLKYLARFRRKGGKEDLEKAKWYLDRLIDTEYGNKSL